MNTKQNKTKSSPKTLTETLGSVTGDVSPAGPGSLLEMLTTTSSGRQSRDVSPLPSSFLRRTAESPIIEHEDLGRGADLARAFLSTPEETSPRDDVTPRTDVSAQSGMNSASAIDELDVLNTSQQMNRVAQMAKMLVVILLPLLTLVVIVSIRLSSNVDKGQRATRARDGLAVYVLLDDVCAAVRRERTLAAAVCASRSNDSRLANSLHHLYSVTDDALARLSVHSPGSTTVHVTSSASSETDVPGALNDVRQMTSLTQGNRTFSDVIELYERISTALITWSEQVVVLPESANDNWKLLVTTSTLLQASDTLGVQEALGTAFFIQCHHTEAACRTFTRKGVESRALMTFAAQYDDQASLAIEALGHKQRQGPSMETLVHQLRSADFALQCKKTSTATRYVQIDVWMKVFDDYLADVRMIRNDVISRLKVLLSAQVDYLHRDVTMYSIIMSAVVLTGLAMCTWYAYNVQAMLQRLRVFARRSAKKSVEVRRERNRSNRLLNELLPRPVCEQLKLGHDVTAEYFDEASICFSDIVDFTAMAARSTPQQIINLLNKLYSLFDSILERYHVYKVETVGDAYMVTSGAPERWADHASELSHLALELSLSLRDFAIPHNSARLKIRIGIHTGALVGGVVGHRMPRYCVFGTSVHIANKMESTSKPEKIQVTEATRTILNASGFITEARHDGDNPVFCGELMRTFWLTSCQHLTITEITSLKEYREAHANLRRSSDEHTHRHVVTPQF